MAEPPLLGVPAASAATSPPPAAAPPMPSPVGSSARRTMLTLTAIALALLAWRGYGLTRSSTAPFAVERDVVPLVVIDVNTATTAELASVPGLGPTLADRIVVHRRTQGEFRSVDELRKVRGIGERTLERAGPFLVVATNVRDDTPPPVAVKGTKKPPPGAKVDVNRADAAELQKLPGIGPTLAGRIVEQRRKQPFAAVEDLRKVKGIGPKTLDGVRPFVTVGGD